MHRHRFAWAWTIGCVLVAGELSAQTGAEVHRSNLAGPKRGTIADLAALPCDDGLPFMFLATDGTSGTDCVVGGGAEEGICLCLDGSLVSIAAGGGTDDQTAPEVPYAPADDADWTDPDPTEVGGALDDLAARVTDDEAALSTHAGNADAHHAEDHALDSHSGTIPAAQVDDGGAASTFALFSGAGGAAAFRAIADGDVPDTITVNLAATASALAANGGNCAAGQWAAGVDAAGAAEGCTADATLAGAAAGGDLAGTYPNPTVAAGAVGITELADDAGCGALHGVRRNAGDTAFECAAGGGIGGSTGATDNRIVRSDGTDGSTIQSSAVEINDAGQILVSQTTFLTPSLSGQGDTNTGFHIGRAADFIEVINGGARTWYWEATGAFGVTNTAMGAYMVADNGHNNATPAYGFRNDLNTGLRPASSGDTGSAVVVCNGAPCATFAPGAVTFNAAQFITTPQATAPATCTVGAFYTDNSGGLALCACTATNTWTLWLPAVVTTENCT